MMEFFDLIHKRQSIRAYQDRQVENDKIEKILKATNIAPSAGNLQAYEIFLVSDKDQRAALAQATLGQDFISQAPVVLVFCKHPARSEWRYHQRGVSLYTIQDATIACTYAMLAAVDLGLGCVWVGAFNDDVVMDVLGNPLDLMAVAMLPIGYPAEEPQARPRRSLDELVHRL
jgi:nitroreductase